MRFLRVVIFSIFMVLAVTGLANVTSQVNRTGPYTIGSLPATLSVVFPFQTAAEVLVLNLGQSGTENDPAVVLTLNSDYTVTGGGYNSSLNMQSGNLVVVAGGAHAVEAGDKIVILRNVPVNQTVSFGSGPITASILERAFDKQATLSQQLTEVSGRSLRFESGEVLDGVLNRTARAGKLLGFDSSGNIEYSTGGSGGGGTTYTAGVGLALASNEFSVLPDQSFTTLTVTDPITGDLTGNAGTASALETARTINGVSFDGTANITVPAAAATLTGTALASNIVSSSLTFLAGGTVGTMAFQNSNAVSLTGGTANGVAITGLANGVNPTDAVNYSQLLSVSAGIVVRTQVVAATTANISLSAPQTIDGQAVIAGNRVLVKNQTAPEENGIYDVAAGAWTRSTDSNTAGELLVGYTYFVTSGATQGSSTWTISVAPTILNTDPVRFVQFSAAQNYSAGTGLNLGGNVFSIGSIQSGLTINSSAFNGTIGLTTPSTGAFTQTVTSGNTYAANLVLKGGQVNEVATNAVAEVAVNYDGYAGGTTQFRNFTVYDGKNTPFVTLTGSTKGALFAGPITSSSSGALFSRTGASTASQYIRMANTSGNAFFGVENSTGSDFTATAYSTVVYGVSEVDVIAGTKVGAFTSGGLALTGAYSVNSNANLRTTKTNFHYGKVVNVMDYGAVGDGSNDDTSAINSAIQALTDYSALYFPATGNYYKITAGLWEFNNLDHIRVFGDGPASRIHSTVTGAASNTFTINSDCTYVEIDHLAITGSATIRGNGCHIRLFSNYSSAHHNYVAGCSDFGIFLDGAYNVGSSITDNLVADTLGDGVHVGGCTDFIVSRNNFLNTGDDSVGVIGTDATYKPNRGLVSENIVYNSGSRGIVLEEGVDIKITNNAIYESVLSPLRVGRYLSTTFYNSRVVVSDNKTYLGNSTPGPLGAIWIEFANECDVSNNRVTAPHNGNGIAILDCNNLDVSNNRIKGAPSRGIGTDDTTTANVNTTWTRIQYRNNHVESNTANQGYYLKPNNSTTITNALITGNTASGSPSGDYIYYDRVTTAKILLNTSLEGRAIGAGGTVSGVTATPNY